MPPSIWEAARSGDSAALSEWAFAPGTHINIDDERGWTPLMHAAAGGQVGAVRLLLGLGAKVNQHPLGEPHALVCAVQGGGNPEVLRSLLLADARVPRKQARIEAARLGQVDTLRLLDTLPPPGSDAPFAGYSLYALKYAAAAGQLDAVRYLLDAGPTPQQLHKALEAAAGAGHAPVMQALIEAGADPHVVDHDGQTLLMRAARRDHLDAARVLLEHGAVLPPPPRAGQATAPDDPAHFMKVMESALLRGTPVEEVAAHLTAEVGEQPDLLAAHGHYTQVLAAAQTPTPHSSSTTPATALAGGGPPH